MSKSSNIVVDVTRPIPEWGLSHAVSTAVPISVSGAEVKSTRDVSNGIQNILRMRVKDKLKEAKGLVSNAKKQKHPTVFRVGRRSRSGAFVARKTTK